MPTPTTTTPTTTPFDPVTKGGQLNPTYREGPVAKAIEEKTSRLPSDLFLWSAGGVLAASLALQAMHQKERSNFVGQFVPTLLLLGLYNKVVKLLGSERTD